MTGAAAFAIRLAREADAPEIARLSGELGYATTADTMAARLAAVLPQADHCVVVAASGDGRLLGWAAVEIRTLLVAGRKAELMGLVVAGEARRLGVGRGLVRAAEAWTGRRGFDRLTVRSNVLRAESHPFYERLGYVRVKTQHLYVKEISAA